VTRELKTDILIIGGGTGAVAAALAAAALGKSVILTEETDWIGGQLTSQAVPPDENTALRTNKGGGTARYHDFRERVRDYYRRNHPLTDAARNDPLLNPGGGSVSWLCHEFRIGHAVLEEMLAPHRTTGRVRVMTRYKPIAASVDGDRVRSVTVHSLLDQHDVTISAPYVLDATELGDVLKLTKTEYVTGAESQKQTREPHAADTPMPENVQSFTWCFPIAFDPTDGADHTIDKPAQYQRWRDYTPHLTPAWPGKMFSWTYSQPRTLEPITRTLFNRDGQKGTSFWQYRKIIRNDIYRAGHTPHEATLVNWPQNDYWEHNVIDKPAEDVAVYLEEARQLSLSLMYWMQTEAPRHDDKGTGYRGVYLRPDLVGSQDGLAQAPYFRESRRIKAVFTVTENHVGKEARKGQDKAEQFADSVGIGHYNIDLHPSTGGKNYIDVPSMPFQIPLGALLPIRMENLLPACKNLGVTHITNGCYRLHPVEWNIGESAGYLAAFCLDKNVPPRAVREKKELLDEFQKLLRDQGVILSW
jgi:hypothetical protein